MARCSSTTCRERKGPAAFASSSRAGPGLPLPFILTLTSRNAFGMSFQTAWEPWRDSLVKEMRASPEPSAASAPAHQHGTHRAFSALAERYESHLRRKQVRAKRRRLIKSHYRGAKNDSADAMGRVRTSDAGRRPFVLAARVSRPLPHQERSLRRSKRLADQADDRCSTHSARRSTGRRNCRCSGCSRHDKTRTAHTRLRKPSWRSRPPVSTWQWADPRWSPDGTRIVAVNRVTGGPKS